MFKMQVVLTLAVGLDSHNDALRPEGRIAGRWLLVGIGSRFPDRVSHFCHQSASAGSVPAEAGPQAAAACSACTAVVIGIAVCVVRPIGDAFGQDRDVEPRRMCARCCPG